MSARRWVKNQKSEVSLKKKMTPSMRYEIMEHTADVGLRVFGKDLKELFANAAEGLFDLIVGDLGTIQPEQMISLTVEAQDLEELFADWLRELLYLCNAERWLFSKFEVLDIDSKRLKARCFGEPYDPSRHEWEMEIKAVTYHRLRVEEVTAGWRAQVIFDI